MTVDSNARRQAILYEIAAVATRYEQDTAPGFGFERKTDLRDALEQLDHYYDMPGPLIELAGRCVAWLENLEAEKAKA